MKSPFLKLDPLSRRAFVERLAHSAFGLSILPLLGTEPLCAAEAANTAQPLPGFGSAQHVILLNLVGGMSHIDTFDPKTGASKGPASAVSTKADFQLSSFLPETIKVADKICVIRSMTAKVGVHQQAQYLMRTGFEKRGTVVHPTLGAWAQNYLGPSHKTLPSTVCVNRNSGHGNGFLPAITSPLPILDPEAGLQNSTSSVPTPIRDKRLSLLHELDHEFHGSQPDENVQAYDDFYTNTLQLMQSNDLASFDLSKESSAVRTEYGQSKFGQGCLLARRLVEGGVRFIEVESGGWDMHKDIEGSMEKVGAEFDQAFAALIKDLDRRGLLDKTLVAVTTEFGRKPQFEGGGRGHHPKGFSCVLAGAGAKRGYVHGATDATGYEPASDGLTVGDLHATIGHALGLPLAKEIISPSGRPFTIGNHGKPALAVFA
jgi:hypothetical protein